MVARCLSAWCALVLLAGIAGAAGLEQVAQQGPGPQPQIRVGPNAHISRATADRMLTETDMAAHPTNPNRLLACSMIFTPEDISFHNVAFVSDDGGATWSLAVEIDHTTFVGDPDCNYGPDGSAYLVSLALHYEATADHEMLVHRSPDGGVTWQDSTILPFIDREYIAADDTRGEHHGRLYLHGNTVDQPTVDGGERIVFTLFRSDDGGRSFTGPDRILPVGEAFPVGTGNGVVLGDGSYVMSYFQLPSQEALVEEPEEQQGTVEVLRSLDGGDSFEAAASVSAYHPCWGVGQGGMPYLAADRSGGAFGDRLYLVWSDNRSERCEILLSHSSDRGATWSAPVTVNDDHAPEDWLRGANHSMPVVAVNSAGVVGVTWFDRREDPDSLGWWARFAASFDGGETFLPSVKVSEVARGSDHSTFVPIYGFASGGGYRRPSQRGGPLRLTIGPDFGFFLGAGDTGGMAVGADGVCHPQWIDDRTGVPQIWTAAVTVTGRAMPNGSPDLADLDDLTGLVTIDLANSNFDPATKLTTIDATLVNTSDSALSTPLKLRVIGLESRLAVPEIVGSDNGISGVGAVWDLSDLIDGGSLGPGQSSRPRRLRFHMKDLQPFEPKGLALGPFIELEAKVLGRAAGAR